MIKDLLIEQLVGQKAVDQKAVGQKAVDQKYVDQKAVDPRFVDQNITVDGRNPAPLLQLLPFFASHDPSHTPCLILRRQECRGDGFE